MTDRYHALTVILQQDIREDDAQPIIDAILQLRGVLSVTPHVTNLSDHSARMLVRNELSEKLWLALHSDTKATVS